MCNNSYFDSMEQENIINLRRSNERFNLGFENIEPTIRMAEIDATAKKGKRKCSIELKTRKETIDQIKKYGDLLIEPGKMHYFSRIMESGYSLNEEVYYINFCKDGVIVFNFNDIKNINVYPNHRHFNPGINRYENETRFGLNLNDCKIYKYD